MDISLTIKDNETGDYVVIPVLPERIEYKDGEKLADTVHVLNLGEIDFLNGVALDSFGWSAEFPATYDPSYVVTSDLQTPRAYRSQFSAWKEAGTPLQIICPEAGINKRMYLKTYVWDLRGHEGDIYYTVMFREKKSIAPVKIKTDSPKPPAKKEVRPAAAKTPAKTAAKDSGKAYTVSSGDSLTKIAKKLGIKDWRKELYEPNKKPKGPLGNDPNVIMPGQKLKLP